MKKNKTAMRFSFEEIPPEVQMIMAIQMTFEMTGIGVGEKLAKKCMATIKKYPEWFPEENKALDKIKNDNNEKRNTGKGSSVVG